MSASPKTARRRSLLAATAVAAAAALAPASALAGPPTGNYAQFNHCPTSNANVRSCLYSKTTSGSFQLGTSTVPINKTIILQGGTGDEDATTGAATFYNAVGADTLSKTALNVPGGLTGLITPPISWSAPLRALFYTAVNAGNDVTATAELVAPVGYNFRNYAFQTGTAIQLPVRIHLQNPFLGSSCYIGSSASPVTLKLTTGTTAPPSPNSPLAGSLGDIAFQDNGDLYNITNNKLVDNAFSVPAAQDCGPFGFQWAVTPIVNLKEGLPAAAGKNSATLQGSVDLANVTAVVASGS